MKTIVYFGAVSKYNNLGDEACFQAIRSYLPNYVKIYTWYEGDYPYKFLPDLLIIGGGTVFNTLSKEDSLYYKGTELKNFLKLQQQDVPTIMWGSGVLPDLTLPGGAEKDKTTTHPDCVDILDNMDFVGVRGPFSQEKLEKIGFENLKIVGDPALILVNNSNIRAQNRIGFNFSYMYEFFYGTHESVQKEVKKIINALKKTYEVVFFSLHPMDETFANAFDVSVRPFNPDLKSLFKFIKSCRCIIGTKLHAAIFSAACNVPFISWAYRDKCFDFVQYLEMPELAIRTDDKDLYNKTIELVNDFKKEKIRNFIINKIIEKKIECTRAQEDIANIVGKLIDEKY